MSSLFKNIKKRQEAAKREAAELAAASKREQREAAKIGRQIAKAQQDERRSLIKDPSGTRAIVRDLQTNQRIARLNQRDLERMAKQAEKRSRQRF